MNTEYRYLGILAFWVILWTFAPIIAFPLFIIMVVKHFMAIREQRKLQKIALSIDRARWAQMEGFNEAETDSADWWKN